MDFTAIAQQCAPNVAPQTLMAVARVESSFNPYAIGVVGGRLERQPRNQAEAVATARNLERQNYNFSLGATQVNRYNLPKYNESYDTIFDVCRNFKTGAAILEECFVRAKRRFGEDQASLRAAFSCYYSGNFSTGFRHGYVQKVVAAASEPAPIAVVPNVNRGASTTRAAPASTSTTDTREPVDVVMLRAKKAEPQKVAPSWHVAPIPRKGPSKGSMKYERAEDADETDGH